MGTTTSSANGSRFAYIDGDDLPLAGFPFAPGPARRCLLAIPLVSRLAVLDLAGTHGAPIGLLNQLLRSPLPMFEVRDGLLALLLGEHLRLGFHVQRHASHGRTIDALTVVHLDLLARVGVAVLRTTESSEKLQLSRRAAAAQPGQRFRDTDAWSIAPCALQIQLGNLHIAAEEPDRHVGAWPALALAWVAALRTVQGQLFRHVFEPLDPARAHQMRQPRPEPAHEFLEPVDVGRLFPWGIGDRLPDEFLDNRAQSGEKLILDGVSIVHNLQMKLSPIA